MLRLTGGMQPGTGEAPVPGTLILWCGLHLLSNCGLSKGSAAHSAVVPAKAGTHNHRLVECAQIAWPVVMGPASPFAALAPAGTTTSRDKRNAGTAPKIHGLKGSAPPIYTETPRLAECSAVW